MASFSSRLPIDEILPDVVAALKRAPNLVLSSPPGTGKTTRLPPAILDAGLLESGKLVILEPRRLAARAAARRIAAERSCRVGEEVGYHVRFDRQAGARTRVLAVTPGILLRLLLADPYLETVSTLVFDEFHERTLDADLCFAMARLLQQTVRPNLRLIVMSATLDTASLATYLGDCPVFRHEARNHPVEIRYESRSVDRNWGDTVAAAVATLLDQTAGDFLAFLPGMQEIRQASLALQPFAESRGLTLRSLHGDLPPEEQDQALLPAAGRKVVLATNIAESSVTVEGVSVVIDTGVARVLHFDASVGIDRLELLPIAKDSADQRAGRAGRTGPGICLRLWSEANHRHRPERSLAEIERADLTGAILSLAAVGEKEPAKFPWFQPPPPDAIAQALTLLEQLGALENGKITDLGVRMATLPVSPRLARMLLEGQRLGHADRAALAAALLSERDPFSRPDVRCTLPSESDLLDRVEALEAFERHGEKNFSIGHLHGGAGRFILRGRDQLLRILRQEFADSRNVADELDENEAVLRAVLAGFPDRLARRRAHDATRGIMVGGRGVRLSPASRVTEAELFVCLDIDGQGSEATVRLASRVQRDWLPAQSLATENVVAFDDVSERVVAIRRLRYVDLTLEDRPTGNVPTDQAERLVIAKALDQPNRVAPDEDSSAGRLLRRIRWLAGQMPELNLPTFEGPELREVISSLSLGCRSFSEVRNADWLGWLQGALTPRQRRMLEREAPDHIEVPGGRRVALDYSQERPPILAARIQELFGWRETPRIGGGKVRLVLHLLAPNNRPQQITEDLASFWANTYPQVRKDLRARYPKHAWPEDPLTAIASRRPHGSKSKG